MANQEHLALLKQGKTSWNQWRVDHPEIEPDLRDVDFEEIDLTGVDLKGVDLRGSFLSREWDGMDLQRVNISGEDLNYAMLEGINFRGANLSGICFDSAILTEVDLQGANLQRANLSDHYSCISLKAWFPRPLSEAEPEREKTGELRGRPDEFEW